MKYLYALLLVLFSTPSIAQNTEDIGNLYAAILANKNSIFMRLAENDLFVCNHMGLMFPWNNDESYHLRMNSEQDKLSLIHRLELNRNYYGFLFLNNPTHNTRILDAGCGAGAAAVLMHKTFGCCVDGYTLSADEVTFAQSLAKKYDCDNSLRFFKGDFLHLPAQDDTYDVIWVGESSEHISSLSEMFTEFKRVGKNTTRLVVFAWCWNNYEGKKMLDSYDLTDLHQTSEYLLQAEKQQFHCTFQQDLTPWALSYWRLFIMAGLASEEEIAIAKAFESGDLEYHLFCFDLKK